MQDLISCPEYDSITFDLASFHLKRLISICFYSSWLNTEQRWKEPCLKMIRITPWRSMQLAMTLADLVEIKYNLHAMPEATKVQKIMEIKDLSTLSLCNASTATKEVCKNICTASWMKFNEGSPSKLLEHLRMQNINLFSTIRSWGIKLTKIHV